MTTILISKEAGNGYYYRFSSLLQHPDDRDAVADMGKAKRDAKDCWDIFRGVAMPENWLEICRERLKELNGIRPDGDEWDDQLPEVAALLSMGYAKVKHYHFEI